VESKPGLQGISPTARGTIEGLVQERLRPFGLGRVLVRPAFDHGGDAVLEVHAAFGSAGGAVEGQAGCEQSAPRSPH
jgi:hypothetical protein